MKKTCSNCKSDFCNKWQWLSPLKPTNSSPKNIKVCVADAMRVLRFIPIISIQSPTLMKWVELVKIYLENLPGNTLHVALDGYSPGDKNIFKKSSRKYNRK